MRKLVLLLAALVVSPVVVDSASAASRTLAFVTSQRLEQLCGQNGGTFSTTPGGYYSCEKQCTSSSDAFVKLQ